MTREKCDLFECDKCGTLIVCHPIGSQLVSGSPWHLYTRKLTDKEHTLVKNDTGLYVDKCGTWKLLGVVDADADTGDIYSKPEQRELTDKEKMIARWNNSSTESEPVYIKITVEKAEKKEEE